MDPLTSLLLKAENLYLMAGVWVIQEMANRLLPPRVTQSQTWVRLAPVLPILMCLAGVWLPGIMPAGVPWTEYVLTGLILGYAIGHSRKIFMQGVLGRDPRLVKEGQENSAVVQPIPPVPKADEPGATL